MTRSKRQRATAAAAALCLSALWLLTPVWPAPAGAQGPPYVDYDVDDDGLIEVSSLAQLNAIRWNLDGDQWSDSYPLHRDGNVGNTAQDRLRNWAAAFPNSQYRMGCPYFGCRGYELVADLDFDTNDNGKADSGDEFWNGGKGWVPIFGGEAIYDYRANLRFTDLMHDHRGAHIAGDRPHSRARMFTGIFEGNGHTIANLYINDPQRWYAGLFGSIGPGGHVRNVGLTAPNADSRVHGRQYVGTLAGILHGGYHSIGGRVSGVWSDVDVAGYSDIGGLVGASSFRSYIAESYATGDVTGEVNVGGFAGLLNYSGAAASYATGDVTGEVNVGGFTGLRPDAHLRATYATGSVTFTEGTSALRKSAFGGLIGTLTHAYGASWPRANYATGRVSAPPGASAGGLMGLCMSSNRPRAEGGNYWDTETTGMATSPGCGVGYTTAELQAPTDYTGIYADWNVDVDVDGFNASGRAYLGPGDDPWDFGTSSEYPVLKYCADKPGIDTADGLPYCPLQSWRQRGQPAPDPPVPDPPPSAVVLPVVSVAGDGSVGEGSFAVFTLSVAPPPSGGLVVQVTVRSSDFGVLSQTRVVRIPASGTAKVYVATAVDYDSDDGWVTVSVDDDPEDTAAYAVSATQGAATVTVLDND